MKRSFVVLFALLALGAAVLAQDDLARLLREAGSAKEYPNAPYILVRDQTRVQVRDSGLSLVTHETLYKVLTAEGARQLKSLTFGYDPLSASVEVKAARRVLKSGEVTDLALGTVQDYPAPARAIYWGAREKLLPVGRLETGDGVWVKTLQKGFTYALLAGEGEEDDARFIPPMRGHFYDIVPFYSEVPVVLKSYEVRLPAGKRLQFEFYNGEARHWAHTEGEETVYFWEKKNIQPMSAEAGMVAESDVAPKLLLSTSPDWQAKSLWFYKVNEDFHSFDPDQAVRDKVAEILRGATDTWDKISRLTHWVAEEIRYSGISMGKGEGYTLHPGPMTLLDRCGVCKDKAGMLITMLRAAGFESYPAMTMAGSRIDRIPADQFNHSVTIVKVDGQYHLLDPTWVPGVRELWSSAEQQQEYLMGLPEGADLKSTPLSPPEKHYLRFRIAASLSADGTLGGKLSVEAEGQSDSNLRRLFTRRFKATWDTWLAETLAGLYPGIRLRDITRTDPDDLSTPMRLSCAFEIPGYAVMGRQRAYLRCLAGRLPFREGVAFLNAPSLPEKRQYPFRGRSSQLVELEETIQLPAGWKRLSAPEVKPTSGTGADFNGSVSVADGSLRVEQRLALKKRIYAVEDWDSVRDGVREFRKVMDQTFVLSTGGEK